MGLIDEIAHAVPVERLLFEAPRKEQQVWFLQRFGHEVNLGNIAPRDVLSLETLRLGLRADTVPAHPPQPPARMILLARHGETDDNVPPLRFQGQRDTPLNEQRARAGARAGRAGRGDRAADRLAVVQRPSRARETAEIVGARIGLEPRARRAPARGLARRVGGLPVRRDRRERSRALRRLAQARTPRSASTSPAARRWREQQARVLRSALARDRRRLAAAARRSSVCHGGSIRSVLCRARPARPRRLPQRSRCRTSRSSRSRSAELR